MTSFCQATLPRWKIDGKRLRCENDVIFPKFVTYGPFPPDRNTSLRRDFEQISELGLDGIRTYELPSKALLDEAAAQGLRVLAGLDWAQYENWFTRPDRFSSAKVKLSAFLDEFHIHPALVGVIIGNEIPADLVRFMEAHRVRESLDELILLGKSLAPHLLFAYANFPTTEHLEPQHADFTAFNIYLEQPYAFESYLQRLHHIAGDRPVFLTEIGLDSMRNGEAQQADHLRWSMELAEQAGCAGITFFSWSDEWQNNRQRVEDWQFGIIRRDGSLKPAAQIFHQARAFSKTISSIEKISVIVCTRNGASRIGACLQALEQQSDTNFEVIVIDDGSSDSTATLVGNQFPEFQLFSQAPSGLSSARNRGATLASGKLLAYTDDDCVPDSHWVFELRRLWQSGQFDAVGGPNLAPKGKNWQEAVITSLPGGPSHILFDDKRAEHLPGCNLAVTRAAFDAIGGFDPQFKTAGDDVDFCWRLLEKGFQLGFSPTAFVWHIRRQDSLAFLKQQIGYGKAEKLLRLKFPQKFNQRGDAMWKGFIYTGGVITAQENQPIFHGELGSAGFQSVINRSIPLRPIDPEFSGFKAQALRSVLACLAPILRRWHRCRRCLFPRSVHPAQHKYPYAGSDSFRVSTPLNRDAYLQSLIASDWRAAAADSGWDVERGIHKLQVAEELHLDGTRTLWVKSLHALTSREWENFTI